MEKVKKCDKNVFINGLSDLLEYCNYSQNQGTINLKINLGNQENDLFLQRNIEQTLEAIKNIIMLNPDVQISIMDDRIFGDVVSTPERERQIKGEFAQLTYVKDRLLEIEELREAKNIFIATPGHSYFNLHNCLVYSIRTVSLKDIYDSEEFIRAVANEINNSELTTLEKIFAAYTTVIKMKKYKDVDEFANQCDSRNLYTSLNEDTIVCEGFVNIFNSILGEMGIKSTVGIFKIVGGNHAISVVEVDDPEMYISGNFIFDPTRDSKLYHASKYNKKGEFKVSVAPMSGFALSEEEFTKKYGVSLGSVKINHSGATKEPLKFKRKQSSSMQMSGLLANYSSILSGDKYTLDGEIADQSLEKEDLQQLYESYFSIISVAGEYLGEDYIFNNLINHRMKH